MINIFFRFDDPSEISDHELEKRILEVFAKYNAKLCLAVIPFKKKWKDSSDSIYSLSDSKALHMAEAASSGIAEIAQHGFSHINWAETDKSSEFVGLPYESQKKNIMAGREHLSNIFAQTIEGFVPPFNTYDANTLKVVDEQEFTYLSASWETPAVNCRQSKVSIIPRTCNLNSLKAALDEAIKYKSLSPIIGVVLHHDEFEEHIHAKSKENKRTFTNLNELDKILRFISLHDEMEICHISEIGQKFIALRELKHISNKDWLDGLNWRFKKFFPRHLIFTCSRTNIAYITTKQFLGFS